MSDDDGRRTPARVSNRPGLGAVRYRVGTHESFKRTMLARLAEVAPDLSTRDDDDFAVAFLDGVATFADVFTMYQELHANETWLRTATERRSVLELARLVGYELRPGVAAEAALAFTLEGTRGEEVTIPTGTAVQSTPAPGEQPQTFETVEDVPARVAWNALRPRLTVRHPLPYKKGTRLVFEGTATVTPGDGVLWEQDGRPMFGIVGEVDQRPERVATALRAGRPAHTVVTVRLAKAKAAHAAGVSLGTSVPEPGPLGARYAGRTVAAADLVAEAAAGGFAVADVLASLRASRPGAPRALVFRARASVFGHNAPTWASLPSALRGGEWVDTKSGRKFVEGPYADRARTWAGGTLARYDVQVANTPAVFVDTHQRGVGPGDVVVLRDGDAWAVYDVSGARDVTKTAFSITGPATRLTLDSATGLRKFGIRSTQAYLRGEALPLAEVPASVELPRETFVLGDWVEGLRAGLRVSVEGESSDERGTRVTHVTTLAEVAHVFTSGGGTRVRLAQPLPVALVRDTVTLNANVARATHGQTAGELLGSGDARVAFHEFPLRQPPLTYVGAANATGSRSTLTVYVDDVAWTEVPTLHGRGPEERVYVVRHGDDGTTVVRFGDGRTGARLPTGESNVRARYRRGSGLGGLVGAGRLDVPMSRPVPITAVTNPLAATGADDPERIESARTNAPLPIKTLGRVVSLRDYEDFARSFPGVAKARAVWVPGVRRGVVVTIAGPAGAVPGPDDPVTRNLLDALRSCGDPYVPVRVVPYVPLHFRLAGEVAVDPARERAVVVRAVEAALRAAYGFDARELGRPVTAGEVLATIHSVTGVVAARLTELYRAEKEKPGLAATLHAASPRAGSSAPAPAELLTLDAKPLALGVLA